MNGWRAVRGGAVLAFGLLTMTPEDASAQKRRRELIKNEEFVATVTADVNLYTAIRRLRPHFFEARAVRTLGGGVVNPLRVYFERNEQPFEVLETVLAWDVEEARYFTPSEAGDRYGDRANGGVILVKMLKNKKSDAPKKDSTPP
jgi:hypothetical protein